MISLFKLEPKFKISKIVYAKYVCMWTFRRRTMTLKIIRVRVMGRENLINRVRRVNRRNLPLLTHYTRRL